MLGDGGNWIHRIFIFTLYSPFTCFKTSRQILSFWIFFSLSVCVCACSQSSVCARVPAQAKVETRSALGSLSFWMPRAHTETDTRHNGTRVALSFSFMTKQIWLVNVIILVAILSEGEKQTTIIFATHYQLFPTVPHSGAHREYEGEKPWPKLVGLQRTGRILWPANGWVSFCNTGGCWMICFRSIFCGKKHVFISTLK